ncbi:MAG: SOUL family heme-binding protein [Pseudomonadales bacterium]
MVHRHPHILMVTALLALLASASVHAVPQLAYQVEATVGDVEVRRYAPHLLASVQVDANFEAAGNRAFRPLFRFIDGNNSRGEEISMTAPVLQSAGTAGWEVSFVMPEGYRMDTLPRPEQQEVQIRSASGELMAALAYSGRWSESRYRLHETALREALQTSEYQICGEPLWARYDPPFKPWFMRRNEVLIPVAKGSC